MKKAILAFAAFLFSCSIASAATPEKFSSAKPIKIVHESSDVKVHASKEPQKHSTNKVSESGDHTVKLSHPKN